MFAKGPMPGATPRANFLKRWPGATCKREYYENGIRAYVVSDAKGEFIAARGAPAHAWDYAFSVMLRREERALEEAAAKLAKPAKSAKRLAKNKPALPKPKK